MKLNAKPKPRKRGRPPLPESAPHSEGRTVFLYPDEWARVLKIGEGSQSTGVRRLLAAHKETPPGG